MKICICCKQTRSICKPDLIFRRCKAFTMKTIEFKDPSYKTTSQVCKPRETSTTAVAAARTDNNSAEVIVLYPREILDRQTGIPQRTIPLTTNDRFYKFNKFFCEG